MLSDPLAISASYLTAPGQPAISRETNKSVYRQTVGGKLFTSEVSHSYTNGRRRTKVGLAVKAIVTDSFVTNTNVEDTTNVYLVIDRSERLVTDADVLAYTKELIGGVLASTTAANYVPIRTQQIIGGES